MAYSNWGAFVWKNDELRLDMCDEAPKAVMVLNKDNQEVDLSGHAVIELEDVCFTFYKRYFPIISIKENGKWRVLEQLELAKKNDLSLHSLDTFYCINQEKWEKEKVIELSANPKIYLEDESSYLLKINEYCSIDYWNDYWDIGLDKITIRYKDDCYLVVIGQSIGNGFNLKDKINKILLNGFVFDSEKKEYWSKKQVEIKLAKADIKKTQKSLRKDGRMALKRCLKWWFKDNHWARYEFKEAMNNFKLARDYPYTRNTF